MRNLNSTLKKISITEYIKDNGLGSISKVGTSIGSQLGTVYRVIPCPICGGKSDFTIYETTSGEQTFHSFSECCSGGTIADFIIALKKVSTSEAINEALNYGGYVPSEVIKEADLGDYVGRDDLTKQEKLNREILFNCRIPSAQNAYFFSRGIKEHLIDKYKLGYAEKGYNDFVSKIDESMRNNFKYADIYRYLLPITDISGNVLSFISRVDEEILAARREEIGYETKISKAYNAKGLDLPLLNEKYLCCPGSVSKDDYYISYRDEKTLFISEGFFDALSFEALGYHAVALNTANNDKKFIRIIKENYEYIRNFRIILAMDNDADGRLCSKNIKSALTELNLFVKEFDMRGFKDANEFYVKDSLGFKESIANVLKSTEFNSIGYFLGNKFLEKARKKASIGVIPTGLKALDDIIGGGLYAEELTIIAAESSLGKTTLAINIANNVAGQGHPVLYFAVEQGEFDLSSKLLSRYSFIRNIGDSSLVEAMKNQNNYTARKISYIENMQEYVLQELLFGYQDTVASNHLYFREQNMTMTLDYIQEEVKNFVRITGKTPLVVVDYLQNIELDDPRLTDKQKIDRSMRELKILARDLSLPIIAISSVNRGSYTSRLTFSSLKESGSIEFTADNIIALNLSAIDEISSLGNEAEKKKKYQEAKGSPIRAIDADILKQRNGDIGVTAKLAFVPAFNYYTSM